VTDQVNKRNELIPVEVIAEGIETAISRSAEIGIPPGTPSNVAHDIHRPCGWARPCGLLLTSDMARLAGAMLLPEVEEETQGLMRWRARFLSDHNATESAPFVPELMERTDAGGTLELETGYCGAAVLCAPGLAQNIFPDYFCEADTGIVDKDGLVDYRTLTSRTY
jgi:hypothetical protein